MIGRWRKFSGFSADRPVKGAISPGRGVGIAVGSMGAGMAVGGIAVSVAVGASGCAVVAGCAAASATGWGVLVGVAVGAAAGPLHATTLIITRKKSKTSG